MSAPTAPVMAAPAAADIACRGALSARQRFSMRKHARRASRRENVQWLRQGLMKVATLGQGVGSGMCLQSAQVDGHEERDGITYFRIRVKSADGREWHVYNRYSAFEKLRMELGVRDKRVGSIFPKKTWGRSCSFEQVEQRQQVLQIWLNGLIAEFSSGGNGRNMLLPVFRTRALACLHSFCGVDGIGRLLPDATLVEVGLAGAVTEKYGVFQPSAPPLSVEVADEDDAALAAIPEAAQGRTSVATEDQQLRAALAASIASAALDEEARSAWYAAEAEAACRAEEILQSQQEEEAEAESIAAEVLVRQKAEEEQAACKAEEQLQSQKEAEESEAEHLAMEVLEKQRAQAEAAERQAEEAREAEETREKSADDARQKAEEEEQRRLVAEEEDALRKAEEEAARSKAEKEEALRREAEEEAKKPYLEQAMNIAGAGKELQDEGRTEEALDRYKKSIALFTLAQRKEKAPKVHDAIQLKIEDLTARSAQLSDVLVAAEAAQAAKIMGQPSEDASLLGRVGALLACAPEAELARPALLPALAPAASVAVAQ